MEKDELPDKLLKPYDPGETEKRIYKLWEDSGLFNPDKCIEKGFMDVDAESFSMVLPPPNVTGSLHTGHAVMLAIEDIMTRYNRMLGNKALWIPGTDHAAIATQSRVEKELYKKEDKTRHDLGREEFLKRVGKFAENSHDTIVNQIRRMGASLDWSREAYTLDEKRSLAVRTAFKRMYDAGLIYQGERVVNWDPKLQTTVSDDEVDWVEETTPLYYLKYGPFTIATARPETKFGDKHVVMHPDDSRYKEYKHGDTIKLEWINGPVTATIIKDAVIDMEFGTGVMTITPWHDATDFDVAERHSLDREQIIDLYGKLMPRAGEFEGINIKKARPLIIEKLQGKGLLEKIDEKYVHRIATNSRGGGMIEPQILKQWFVNVNKEFELKNSKIDGIKSGEKTTLKHIMRLAVSNGQVEIIPERFEKEYFHWIDNLRDWCISRQIWFGHQIPVWYKNNDKYAGVEPPSQDWEKEGWTQDQDTLDTWFSSGLWTFSTLGWPENTNDLNTYHPTAALETGYDILFFWVARMILMSGFILGDIPFRKVYLHGLVRDEKGRKMSKSLDNAIDPLKAIEKYGADALRMAMIVGIGPGNDLVITDEKIKAYKHFANKIWNITRFVLANARETGFEEDFKGWSEADTAIRQEIDALLKDVTDDMDNFRFYLAADKLYQYVWHTFADKILEESKNIFKNKDGSEVSRANLLLETLKKIVIALHPFMPFITEEIWSILPIQKKSLLIVEHWPTKQ
jgi:valyl-tRNA synthetase